MYNAIYNILKAGPFFLHTEIKYFYWTIDIEIMGIIYQFAIRFLKVKNISKVNTRCVSENDKDFDDYLIKAKDNRVSKLKQVSLDPSVKRSYVVKDITIPEGTDVITFGNNACDRRGGAYLIIITHRMSMS